VNKVVTPFRVGLLVIVSGAILFGFLTFARKGGLSEREAITVWALFHDASGLTKKSKVQVAGIPVGEITKIELEGNRAKVWLRIKRDVNLRQDAALTKRSESLLGDYLLDLFPGSDVAPEMPDNGEIKKVIDQQGMEQLFNSLNQITSDIQQVTSALRDVLGGEKGAGSLQKIVENLVRVSDAVDSTVRNSSQQLDQILKNIDAISGDIRSITAGEGGDIRKIVQNLSEITTDTREAVKTVAGIIGANEGEVKTGVASLKQTLERLDHVLADVEDVTGKMKEGKGVVGQLVGNERLGQRVSETVEGVADIAQRLTDLQVEVGLRADYLVTQGQAKDVFTVRIIPKPDKYYLLELVDDPRGTVTTTVLQQNPPSTGNPVVQTQTQTTEAIKFSAEFAKRYSFLTLRFGIIESTGGLGADFSVPIKFFYYSKWIEDALVLKVDAFNFSVQSLTYPRIRATLRFTPYEHVYVNIGLDDILNRPNRDVTTNRLITGRDFFFGAGIYFTDDDIKSVLPVIPSFGGAK
jgi:phospholipid/cholesterol/gamma-HCH transport system substrate-binding protein